MSERLGSKDSRAKKPFDLSLRPLRLSFRGSILKYSSQNICSIDERRKEEEDGYVE